MLHSLSFLCTVRTLYKHTCISKTREASDRRESRTDCWSCALRKVLGAERQRRLDMLFTSPCYFRPTFCRDDYDGTTLGCSKTSSFFVSFFFTTKRCIHGNPIRSPLVRTSSYATEMDAYQLQLQSPGHFSVCFVWRRSLVAGGARI